VQKRATYLKTSGGSNVLSWAGLISHLFLRDRNLSNQHKGLLTFL